MKKFSSNWVRLGTFVVSIIAGVSIISCSQSSNELLLDSFEGKISSSTVDFGSSDGTDVDVTASADIKSCGKQSLQLTYDLSEGGWMFCARGYGLDVLGSTWEGPTPDDIDWTTYSALSFQVYGINSGDIAFDVKDNGGEIWRFMLKDDFEGWKTITAPFNEFSVRTDWQPQSADGNKVLDFPVKSYQFEIKTPGSGEIYFDCVKLIKMSAEEKGSH